MSLLARTDRAALSLIAEVRRNARHRADDNADLAMTAPVDAGEVSRGLKAALGRGGHWPSSPDIAGAMLER